MGSPAHTSPPPDSPPPCRTAPEAPASPRPAGLTLAAQLLLRHAILLFLLLLLAYFGVRSEEHRFLTLQNQLTVLNQVPVNLILATGMTFVIISGGIDLSVGSVLALVGVASTSLLMRGLVWGWGEEAAALVGPPSLALGLPLSLLFGLALGTAAGAVNGAFITLFRIPPFIATLAMLTVARGLAYMHTDARSVSFLPDAFTFLGMGLVLGRIPVPAVVALAVAVAAGYVLARTRFGRYVYAVGGNEDAARLSGIPVDRVKLGIYALAGFLAGMAGVLQAARSGAGDPKAGEMFELNAIAAVVLGGASLMGGRGTLWGTVLGALIIAEMNNGLDLMGAQTYQQMVAKGLVILSAVLLDRLRVRYGGG